jgi:isoquinoline 1-oxidoreductase alpha subunit
MGMERMTTFTLNGKKISSSAPGDTPLLWVIRDEFGLKGTKFGCGIAMCGACTVHMNGNPMRSCSLPLAAPTSAPLKA